MLVTGSLNHSFLPIHPHIPGCGLNISKFNNRLKFNVMDNRINVVLTPETKDQILQTVSALKILMPFLIKLSDTDRKALQMLDDGRKPFTQKAYDYASLNNAINSGTEMVLAGMHDLDLYTGLSTVEKDLHQLIQQLQKIDAAA